MENNAGYKNLLAWQVADELASKVYDLSSDFPKSEQFSVTSQLRRAALSVPTNIVEGYARNSKAEFRRFMAGSIALETLQVDYQIANIPKHITIFLSRITNPCQNFQKSIQLQRT